ncbi:MAG: amidase [Actinomycetota bacterium]|nr:amidase [Actinomycetota bacterium]
MGSNDELLHLDATGQAALVRQGQVSAAELVGAAIEAAQQRNPAINAIIHPRYEAALAEAAQVDPAHGGPFAGVPMVVKDLGCTIAGEPHHQGIRALQRAGYRAPHDSALYRRFRRAGFVAIGRTNTPEMGSTITTEPLAYGPTRNPWNLQHSTGGSSGGSAASVAAGIVPVGHANDGGGSIRIPASECGLVGLKPSRGRVSTAPDLGENWAGATIDGAVTRSVRDAAAVLDAIAGYEPGDPYTAPPFARHLREEVGVPPGHLRIGVLDTSALPDMAGGTAFVHPECVAAVQKAADLLQSLGHHVEASSPQAMTDPGFPDRFVTVMAANTQRDVRHFESLAGRTFGDGDLEPDNLFYAQWGASVSAPDYLEMVNQQHAWCREMMSWWHPADHHHGFDLLLTPVIAVPPPAIGWLSGAEGAMRVREIMLFTAQFNVTGQPAISLPLHRTADGLPVGVQLVAAYGREDVLIRVAAQLEAAAPWPLVAPT